MLMSPVGLRSEKGCAGDVQQKLKSTDPTSRQQTQNCQKNIEWVAGPRWVPDTKTNWPTDCSVVI
jgi:hypothetical protein